MNNRTPGFLDPGWRIVVLVAVALGVLVPVGVRLERVLADRLVAAREDDLRASLVGVVASAAREIAATEARVARLAQLLESAAAQADERDAVLFDRTMIRMPNGTYRLPRSIDFSAEAVLWVPRRHALDRHWKGVLSRSRQVIGQLGSGAVGQRVDDVFFITTGGAEAIFIPSDPGYADRPVGDSFDPSAWINPVRASRDPRRRPVWLPSQRSSRPPIWYPALVAPVHDAGTLIGVTGFDLSIGGLFNRADRLAAGPGTAQLVVEMGRGRLLVHGEGAEFDRAVVDSLTVADLPSPLRDSLDALLDRARTAPAGEVIRGAVGSRTLLAARLARPDWVAVTLIERSAIIAPLKAPLRLMRLTLVSVFVILLVSVVGVATRGLRRARAVEARRNAEFVAALNETTLELLGRRNLSELLHALMERMAALIDAPHVEVLLLEGDALVVRARSSSVQAALGMRVSRGEAPLSWAALDSGRPVVIEDYATLPHAPNHYDKHLPRGVIELPVLRGDERLGVISLARSEPDRPFSEEDVRRGELLARQVALVLHNATLYADAVREAERRSADLRQSEERLAFALDATSDGLWDWNIATGDVHFSRQWIRLLGYEEHEVPARVEFFFTVVHPEDAAAVSKALDDHLAGRTPLKQNEIRLRMKSGEYRWFDDRGKVVTRDSDGRPLRMVGTITDITERRQAEEARLRLETQLQRAMKLESVGRLAGGVAHDFNNMLGVIIGHVDFALERADPAQPIHTHLTEIRGAAERSADLTRQLLAFARQQTVAPKVLDLNATVSGMLSMLRRMIGEDIVVTWTPAPDLWLVRIDPSQMDQVLTNLCVNARDAITDVGHVTIATTNCVIEADYCADHPLAVPGEYVRLTVRDTGAGMDAETQSQIFEPFFSTKGPGEGTGLGLATVYGAVTQNRGFITVASEVGVGTVFDVHLPRHNDVEQPAAASTVQAVGAGGQETILVVEDESAILALLTKGLTARGYAVLGAAGPAEALRRAAAHDGTIHLLLTDVIMPEMNGRDLANTLLQTRPQLRVLYMSGYTADVIARHGVLDADVHFIGKPFAVSGLAAAVRTALDARRP